MKKILNVENLKEEYIRITTITGTAPNFLRINLHDKEYLNQMIQELYHEPNIDFLLLPTKIFEEEIELMHFIYTRE